MFLVVVVESIASVLTTQQNHWSSVSNEIKTAYRIILVQRHFDFTNSLSYS